MHKRRRYIHEEIDDSRRFNENCFCFSSGLFTRWKKAVFTKVTVNDKKNDYNIHLWVRDEETEELSQWTFEDGKHHQPVWSKDSRQLAFILQKPKEAPQLALIQCEGGGVRTLTAIPYGVSHPVFSLDGDFLYAAVSLKPSESVHDEKKEERDEFAAAVYDDLTYKADGRGFLDGRFTQIIQVNVHSGEVETVTSGQHHHMNHTLSPCGKWLAYIQSNPQKPYISDMCLQSLEDGTTKKITQSSGAYSTVSFAPNGESLVYIGHEREFQNATFPALWLYDLKEGMSFSCQKCSICMWATVWQGTALWEKPISFRSGQRIARGFMRLFPIKAVQGFIISPLKA